LKDLIFTTYKAHQVRFPGSKCIPEWRHYTNTYSPSPGNQVMWYSLALSNIYRINQLQ
jgi:hypothetical protein